MINRFLGWESCDFLDYEKISFLYGFNNESSPYFINFALKNGANLKFFILMKGGEEVGACCVDNGWICNDVKNPRNQTKNLPIPNNSIQLPFKAGTTCFIPFKSKVFNSTNARVLNSSSKLFSKRNTAIAKLSSDISKKTISTRNREVKKFLLDGGDFKSTKLFSADDLIDIYSELLSIRWPNSNGLNETSKLFVREFKDHIFGDIAFLNNNPVAFQLNLSSISSYGMFVDFINIGYDTEIKSHSLGTIIMWRNLQIAEVSATEINKSLTYSFGMMSGAYKTRWCHPVRVSRIVT